MTTTSPGLAAAGSAASDETVIEVSGLRMRYGAFEAVRGIDLHVTRGEVVAFLGPNGAGKTTTVEILEGYRSRTGGTVTVLGQDPRRGGPSWRARIGVVLQETEPERDLTAAECLQLYAGFYPAPRDVGETLELVGLADKADAMASRLSGGQRRRLDVALALIGDPEMLFLDELTVAGGTISASVYYVPGIITLGIIAAALMNLVISVTAQRETGALKRRRATPVPAAAIIAGRALTSVVVALGITALLLAIGSVFYRATVPGRTVPALVVTVIVGALAFCCLGFALASVIRNSDSAQPVTQATMLPLYFISGVFIAVSALPRWLVDVAGFFPVRHLAAALLTAYDPHTTGAGFAPADLLVVALWGIGGLAIALWRFSWVPLSR